MGTGLFHEYMIIQSVAVPYNSLAIYVCICTEEFILFSEKGLHLVLWATIYLNTLNE